MWGPFRRIKLRVLLFLAELDFAQLQSLALVANNRFHAALALAHRLLKILALLYSNYQTALLHATVKPAYQVFGGFFSVFTGYFYHRSLIIP